MPQRALQSLKLQEGHSADEDWLPQRLRMGVEDDWPWWPWVEFEPRRFFGIPEIRPSKHGLFRVWDVPDSTCLQHGDLYHFNPFHTTSGQG